MLTSQSYQQASPAADRVDKTDENHTFILQTLTHVPSKKPKYKASIKYPVLLEFR